jgi:hypothetical protein
MTSAEMVTTWSMEDGTANAHKAYKPVAELIKALNAHLKAQGIEAEEYDFCESPMLKHDTPGARIPQKFHQLIAYAIEGGSEGYYVHVGALLPGPDGMAPKGQLYTVPYLDFGFAKMWRAESAHAMAREAQRFLNAIRWN